MSRYIFKMPDLGEGTVAAEIVECLVKPGDVVQEEQVILEVMTEKATVEVNSPISGRVVSVAGKPGQSVPVGAELIVFDTDAGGDVAATVETAGTSPAPTTATDQPVPSEAPATIDTQPRGRVMASPATRRRAREASVDLAAVIGTGPGGRIGRNDLDKYLAEGQPSKAQPASDARATSKPPAVPAQGVSEDHVDEIPVIGVRRLIAQRMLDAVRTIPHFTYVEEIDVTELEALRQHLNSKSTAGMASLTYLPFLALALVRVLPQFRQCNARYDSERELLLQHRSLHLGIATQTSNGLKVPVVRSVERRSLHEVAAEIRRVSEAARNNKANRNELTGSTITLTSLGKLGGIASTPIINSPEVAIIGINKAVDRPMVKQGTITVRRMMNISGSFDHRFVDGHDAASMVQALKEMLEHPTLIFAEIK